MKTSLSILGLTSLLATSVFARPRAKVFDDSDPIDQRSQVTAFVVTDEGVKVECWAVDNLLPDSQQSRRHNGISKKWNDKLQGVDLLTWPEPAPLWPPPSSSLHSSALDLSSGPSLFTITTGLILVDVTIAVDLKRMDDDDDDDDDDWGTDNTILSAENGDNWFYFEDNSYGGDSINCAKGKAKVSSPPPLTISTRSATDTTLIQFKYKTSPSHTVLHEGRCRFAGLKPTSQSNRWDEDLRLFRLRTQEL